MILKDQLQFFVSNENTIENSWFCWDTNEIDLEVVIFGFSSIFFHNHCCHDKLPHPPGQPKSHYNYNHILSLLSEL